MTDGLHYECRGASAIITLDRPEKLNAFSMAMVDEMRSMVVAADADPAVVGVVITGTGRGFCAGLDASELGSAVAAGSSGQPSSDGVPGLFSWLLTADKPVIAAVNGVAAGGGFVLALLADLRIASTTASFTTVFSKRGLTAEHGTSWLLPRLVGPSRALDMLWSSRKVDADEAFRIGLIDRLVEPDTLLDEACRYVEDLAENASPASIRDTKRLVYAHLGEPYERAFDEAEAVRLESLDRFDAREGVDSFIERRPAAFRRLGAGEGDAGRD